MLKRRRTTLNCSWCWLNKRRSWFYSPRMKMALGQNVSKLVSSVDIFDSDLRVENDLKVRDTWLIVVLVPLVIILMPASLCSRLVGPLLRSSIKTYFTLCLLRNKFSLLWVWCCEECKTSITKSQKSRAGKPSTCKPASEKNDLKFRLNVKNTILSETSTWKASQWRFWVLKIPKEIGVFEHSQSAMFSNISLDNTAWPAITCTVNKKNQTC